MWSMDTDGINIKLGQVDGFILLLWIELETTDWYQD